MRNTSKAVSGRLRNQAAASSSTAKQKRATSPHPNPPQPEIKMHRVMSRQSASSLDRCPASRAVAKKETMPRGRGLQTSTKSKGSKEVSDAAVFSGRKSQRRQSRNEEVKLTQAHPSQTTFSSIGRNPNDREYNGKDLRVTSQRRMSSSLPPLKAVQLQSKTPQPTSTGRKTRTTRFMSTTEVVPKDVASKTPLPPRARSRRVVKNTFDDPQLSSGEANEEKREEKKKRIDESPKCKIRERDFCCRHKMTTRSLSRRQKAQEGNENQQIGDGQGKVKSNVKLQRNTTASTKTAEDENCVLAKDRINEEENENTATSPSVLSMKAAKTTKSKTQTPKLKSSPPKQQTAVFKGEEIEKCDMRLSTEKDPISLPHHDLVEETAVSPTNTKDVANESQSGFQRISSQVSVQRGLTKLWKLTSHTSPNKQIDNGHEEETDNSVEGNTSLPKENKKDPPPLAFSKNLSSLLDSLQKYSPDPQQQEDSGSSSPLTGWYSPPDEHIGEKNREHRRESRRASRASTTSILSSEIPEAYQPLLDNTLGLLDYSFYAINPGVLDDCRSWNEKKLRHLCRKFNLSDQGSFAEMAGRLSAWHTARIKTYPTSQDNNEQQQQELNFMSQPVDKEELRGFYRPLKRLSLMRRQVSILVSSQLHPSSNQTPQRSEPSRGPTVVRTRRRRSHLLFSPYNQVVEFDLNSEEREGKRDRIVEIAQSIEDINPVEELETEPAWRQARENTLKNLVVTRDLTENNTTGNETPLPNVLDCGLFGTNEEDWMKNLAPNIEGHFPRLSYSPLLHEDEVDFLIPLPFFDCLQPDEMHDEKIKNYTNRRPAPPTPPRSMAS